MVAYNPGLAEDYPEHVKTYRSFVQGVRRAVGAAALVLIALAYFLL